MTFFDRFSEPLYAALRMVLGFLFLLHGSLKLLDFPTAYPYGPLTSLTTAAGIIEMIGGGLIALGLFTRPTAFLCSGTMAVAYWIAHGTQAPLPIMNGGELAVIYCFGFLYIAARGPGIFALDKQ